MDGRPDFLDQGKLDPLNAREMEILGLMSKGLSNNEIALRLSLSMETIKWYNKHIFSKLGVNSRTQAVSKANESGLFEAQTQPQGYKETHPRHNLPAPVTSFIGRKKEIIEIEQLLNTHRFVTLTGAGGSGKTRLALQVAWHLSGHYRDGVWLVELASLIDPASVVHAIAGVLGLTSNLEEGQVTVLKRFLSRKNLLLLLDNFEHLLEAAPLVGEILAIAPNVTILVTSRERLHIYGEHEYPVFPLSLPDLSSKESAVQILGYDALNLFVQRARAVRPGFTLNEQQVNEAVQICTRLDGLPLALELAATQAKFFTLSQLVEQLNESLATLPTGPRDLPARQRTLRATIEWSYSLLNEDEKNLFARIAVFNGGATLDAVEAVCGDLISENIRDRFVSLVDKNLIYPGEGPNGEIYFTMLETIREYALERLEESGVSSMLRRKHADYYTSLADIADKEIRGAKQVYWFARLRAERENLRAVLHWSFASSEIEYGLRLVADLAYFWYYDGFSIEEARSWAGLALGKSTSASAALRAGVMITAGRIAVAYGDLQYSRGILSEAHDIYHRIGDETQAAWALIYQSSCFLGSAKDAQQGLKICQGGLAYFREAEDKYGISQALNILGELSRRAGDYEAARHYYEECLQIANETGEKLRIAMQYDNLSFVAYHQNQPEYAEEMSKRGINSIEDMDSDFGVVTSMPGFAASAILLAAPERAARLLGASHALVEGMGARYQPSDQYEIDQFIEETKRCLSEKAFKAAWQAGAAMTFQEAVAYTLEDTYTVRGR